MKTFFLTLKIEFIHSDLILFHQNKQTQESKLNEDTISIEEFQRIIIARKNKISKEELKKLVSRIDARKSGHVSFSESLNLINRLRRKSIL